MTSQFKEVKISGKDSEKRKKTGLGHHTKSQCNSGRTTAETRVLAA